MEVESEISRKVIFESQTKHLSDRPRDKRSIFCEMPIKSENGESKNPFFHPVMSHFNAQ
jgi:hypothetical protein